MKPGGGAPSFRDKSCGHSPEAPLFVNGAARGVRVFRIDGNDILRGVTYSQPWTPGENVARCMVVRKASPNPVVPQMDRDRFYRMVGAWQYPHDPDMPPVILKGWQSAPCAGVAPECACGFYAYHTVSASATYINSNSAVGIIEGYGRVVLGSAGFRASKARIVALVLPDDEVAERAEKHIRVRDDLEMEIAEAEAAVASLVAAAPARRWWRRSEDDHLRRVQHAAAKAKLEELRLALSAHEASLTVPVRRARVTTRAAAMGRYYGVPMYPTATEMFAAHPIEPLGYLLRD